MEHISLMYAQLETNDINICSISLSHILNDITLLHNPGWDTISDLRFPRDHPVIMFLHFGENSKNRNNLKASKSYGTQHSIINCTKNLLSI